MDINKNKKQQKKAAELGKQVIVTNISLYFYMIYW